MSAKPTSAGQLPTATKLEKPILAALRALGGAGSNADVERRVADDLALTQAQREQPHDTKRGKRTEFAYRMAWARTRLKKQGLIERDGRQRWKLVVTNDQVLHDGTD